MKGLRPKLLREGFRRKEPRSGSLRYDSYAQNSGFMNEECKIRIPQF
jgi:hypothetical protein